METIWGFEVAQIEAVNGGAPPETVYEVVLPDGKVILRPAALERARNVAANPEDFAAQVRAEARDAGIEWEAKRGPKSKVAKDLDEWQKSVDTGSGDKQSLGQS